MTGITATDMVPAERYVPSSEDEEAWRTLRKPQGAKVDKDGNLILASGNVIIPAPIWRKMLEPLPAAFASLDPREESLTGDICAPRAVQQKHSVVTAANQNNIRAREQGKSSCDIGPANPQENEQPGATIDQPARTNEQTAEQYLDRSVDLETLSIPLVQFPGLYKVLPTHEITLGGWSVFLANVAPTPAPIIKEKSDVPYIIAGTLQEAELSKKAQEQFLRKTGQSATVGKARSNDHLNSLGPAFLLDDDGDVLARVPGLQALGCAACVYTSYSYGFIKDGASEPSKGGRVVVCLNRSYSRDEHKPLFYAISHLLRGGFDTAGDRPSQCYGVHARRSADAPRECLVLPGAAFHVDALVTLGRSLLPAKTHANANHKKPSGAPRVPIEEIRSAASAFADHPEVIAVETDWMNKLARPLAYQAACFPDQRDELEQVLDELSQKAPNYNKEENETKFGYYINDAFNRDPTGPNPPITIRSFFSTARNECGWKGFIPAINFRDFTDKGKSRASLANAVIAIKALGIEIKQDLFHHRIVVKHNGEISTVQEGILTDDTIGAIRSLINNTYQLDCGDAHTLAAVKEIARDHSFDPVLDYLDECQRKWDGKKRIDTWVIDYLGCEDTLLNRAIGRLMLIASVRRARVPGCKFDPICVLEGFEGVYKSTVIRVLAGDENFSDQSVLNVSDKEAQEQLEGVWLHESADLTGLKKAEVEKVKAFASRQVDRARPAYGRVREDRQRRNTQWATTNDDAYLASQTGNRRFWPLPVGHIDIDALRRDRDLLWGEAATLEADGASIVLDPRLWSSAAEEQEKRRVVDTWEDVIENMPVSVTERAEPYGTKEVPIIYQSDGKELVCSADVLVHVLKVPTGQQHPEHGKRLARVMKRCGWPHSGRVSILGKQCRGYWRDAKTAAVPQEWIDVSWAYEKWDKDDWKLLETKDESWTETCAGDTSCRKVNGADGAVKRAGSGRWYALRKDGLLARAGRPMWFSTAAEARNTVDHIAAGDDVWCWIACQE
jgi:predicted P-loop ATPase